MPTVRSAPSVDTPESAPSACLSRRLAAIVEVTFAFALVHVSFRAIKHFTAMGQLDVSSGLNFTPGLVMILFTAATLLLCRRSFAAYGISVAQWADGLKLGLLWGLVLVGGAGVLMLFHIRHQAGGPPPTMKEGIAYGLASLVGFLVLARLVRRQSLGLKQVPTGVCSALLLGVFCVPLLVAWYYGRPLFHTLLTVAWLVVGAGIGEEVFYRGYVQSRLNEVFGRPFHLWGVEFGAGLFVSSVLFGFLHASNSVDYFHGRFTFAWGFGVAAFGTGLLYGCLREINGSIVPGAVTHSILDVLARVPTLIP
jgi:membrane protease YdiL (CAAX protease family)